MSAGRNTFERSLIISSKSDSKNSRTKFKFFFAEKTSRSCVGEGMRKGNGAGFMDSISERTYLDHVWVMNFTKILDLTDG